MIKIHIKNPKDIHLNIQNGKTILDILNSLISESLEKYLISGFNNELTDLREQLFVDGELCFFKLETREGLEAFRRGLTLLIFSAIRELSSDATLLVEHSLNAGLYCEFKNIPANLRGGLAWIRGYLKEITSKQETFERFEVSKQEAINIFVKQNQIDTVGLLRYVTFDKVTLYKIREIYGYFFEPLPLHTGYLSKFELEDYPPGFILRFKTSRSEDRVKKNIYDQKKLFSVYHEHENWVKILGVSDVGSLNDKISSGAISTEIKISEALHEKRIAQIADEIYSRKNTRLILISGPTSSGKTTFSKRLEIQMRVLGLKPVVLNLDNYFVDREFTPRTKEGDFDFESINALDLKLFQNDLLDLMKGKQIVMPKYSFSLGKRLGSGTKLGPIDHAQPVIIEGIHGLNDDLTENISDEVKFKIYISALTTLNLDNQNRISTSDNRLIRRIVRDYLFRSYDIKETLSRWSAVRQGEKSHIFTFQEKADVVFNSALIYELAVFKPIILPLLQKVSRDFSEYRNVSRLLNLFSVILEISSEEVPPTSILREFIGGSSFKY